MTFTISSHMFFLLNQELNFQSSNSTSCSRYLSLYYISFDTADMYTHESANTGKIHSPNFQK